MGLNRLLLTLGVGAAASGPVVSLDRLPLRTDGAMVVDRNGERLRLACVNWYGPESPIHVVGGLHKTPMHELVANIVELGFNCVRLPFSVAMVYEDVRVHASNMTAELEYRANLTGENVTDTNTSVSAMQMFDETVEALTAEDAGLLVVLDNHNSEAGWCCEATQEDGLWFTEHYPEDKWINALATMASRYARNPRVVAVELRNEVRDYQNTVATWGPSTHMPLTKDPVEMPEVTPVDWTDAAQRAGNVVLEEDSDMLVMVAGLCYGSDLRGAHDRTVSFSHPNRLVWVVHSYGYFFWQWHWEAHVFGFDVTEGRWRYVAYFLTLVSGALLLLASCVVRCCGADKPFFAPLCEVAGLCCMTIGSVLLAGTALAEGAGQEFGCMETARRHISDLRVQAVWLIALGAASFIGSLALSCFRACCRRDPATAESIESSEAGSPPAGDSQAPTPPSYEKKVIVASPTSVGGVLKLHCRSSLAPLLVCFAAAAAYFAYGCYASSRHWGVHAQLDHMWGFTKEAGHEYTAPVFLNEFGERKNTFFHDALVSYMQERDVDFAYWALNGQKYTDGWWPETYGLLRQSWKGYWGLDRIRGLGLAEGVER